MPSFWDDVIESPTFNLGLGLLAGAPTASPWQAAAQQLNQYQALRQNREYQKLHAKLYEAQARKAESEALDAERARAEAERQRLALTEWAKTQPPEVRDKILAGIVTPKDLSQEASKTLFPQLHNEEIFDPATGKPQHVLRNPFQPNAMPFGGPKLDILTPAELESKRQEQQTLLPGKMAVAAAGRQILAPQIKFGNSLGEAAGTAIGKAVIGEAENSQKQIATIEQAQRLQEAAASGKVMAGPLANARMKAAQVSMMLGYGDSAEGVLETRKAIRGLAQLALKARSSMTSQGSISDFEQRMFNAAMSGNIEDLTAQEIGLIGKYAEQEARAGIERSNTRLDKVFGEDMPQVPKALRVEPPPAKTTPKRRIRVDAEGNILP